MIYIFLADGFEEIEALTTVDILRREGVQVGIVGISKNKIVGAHGIKIETDLTEDEASFENLQGVVLPGGLPGTTNLEASLTVKKAINFCSKNNLLIAAICAAPSILGHMGLLEGKSAVCFPGFEKELIGANVRQTSTCRDGNIITANGPFAAMDFAFEVLKFLNENAPVQP